MPTAEPLTASLPPLADPAPRRAHLGWRPGVALVVGFALAYFVGGLWLSLSQNSIMSDALSRTANGYYPLFSRDPHLAAIGFVWNPLPSLVQLPLLMLTPLWPGLAYQGVAAITQSALFMAGAVYQLHRCVRELGVNGWPAAALTALFALHPEIAYYGMNGMSEASFLFFLLLAVRQLVRWTQTRQTNPLAAAGLALGAAYLTRYEAVAAGLAVIVTVGLVGYLKTAGAPEFRRASARADALVVAAPFAFAVTAWAVTSWLIVGSPFAQFTSANGNSAQTKLAAAGISAIVNQPGGTLGYLLDQSWLLQPFGIVLLVAALVWCAKRRDLALLAPVAVLGGAYGFSVLALLAGQTFGWLRFSITLVPLAVLAAALLIRPAATAARAAVPAGALPAAHRFVGAKAVTDALGRWAGLLPQRRRTAVILVLLLLAAALPAAAVGLFNPGLAREESYFLTGVFAPSRASVQQREVLHRYTQDRTLAAWLDGQHLPTGSVLLDAAVGYSVVMASSDPHQFAITPDRDFPLLLGDPKAHGVRYLVTRPVNRGTPADAISDAYPDLASNPAFRLVRIEPNPGDLSAWHVYAVR